MRRRRLVVPLVLVVLAVVSACGGSDPAPAPSNGPSGSIAGNSAGGISSSGGGGSNGSNGTSGKGGPAPTDYVDTTEESMDFDGATRPYLLSKPKELVDGKKYPLVIAFHGTPGTPQEMREQLPFDYASRGDAFVAYPQAGDGAEWNLNLPSDGNADMDFVKALIDELASNLPIDASRVLGFGYSGGGYFLSQYACRVSGVLKMVAVISGGAPEFHDGDEKRPNDCVVCPAGATPIFIAHGKDDHSEVPFEGGDYARICWAAQNGCTTSSVKNIGGPCQEYKGCEKGKTVQWCAVPDLGHTPWGESMGAAWVMFNGL